MKFPTAPSSIGCINQAKHVITAWGDEQSSDDLSDNPAQISVTDSDQSTGETHAVETYNYDPYVDRWSIDYPTGIHPYFVNIVTLSRAHEDPCSGTTYTVTDSITIENHGLNDASALHYQVGVRDSDTICTYETSVSVDGGLILDNAPQLVLVHQSTKHHYLLVDWEFDTGEVPPLKQVTITTKFTLPQKNTIYYEDVKFGYGDPPVFAPAIPGFEWLIVTPGWQTPGSPGFVIGAFELFADAAGQTPIAQNYFQHEYSGDQDPYLHYFTLRPLGDTADHYVGNLRFGYSNDELSETVLLAFTDFPQTYSVPPILFGPECVMDATLVGRETEELDFQDCNCSPAQPESALADTGFGTANRFLVIDIEGAGSQAIRVTFTDLKPPYDSWNGTEMWVQEPSTKCENSGQTTPPCAGASFAAATLGCTSHYMDWSTVGGRVHIYHEGVIPESQYTVDVIREGCDPAELAYFSSARNVQTSGYGDCCNAFDGSQYPPPNGSIDIVVDVIAILSKFANAPSAPINARADLEPMVVDFRINITDVLRALAGFVGNSYPETPSEPQPCS